MQYLSGSKDIIPISLGYNCHLKVYIDRLGEKDEHAYLHQPFDWIGTPICDLIKSDFSDFANSEIIKLRQKYTDIPYKFLVHLRYIRHDFSKDFQNISEKKWEEVSEKYV